MSFFCLDRELKQQGGGGGASDKHQTCIKKGTLACDLDQGRTE